MRPWITLSILALGLIGVLVAALTATSTSTTIALGTTNGTCRPVIPADTGSATDLTDEQLANAAIIIHTGRELSIPPYGQQIAIATAMQESRLRNLTYGDRDSIGLFQQRPSTGWGTREQLLDPHYASTKFYQALTAIPGWQDMPLWQAAQAVQHSAFPYAYQQWAELAAQLVQHNGGPITCTTPGNEQVEQAIAFATAQLGKPYQWGATGPDAYDCSGLMLRAWQAAGITLNRTSAEQWHNGTPTPLTQATRGDLLFWSYDNTPTAIHHVALYLGNNTIIEAQQPGVPIHTRPITLTPSEPELMLSAVRVSESHVIPRL